MKTPKPIQELDVLVAVALDATGVDPALNHIDKVIPDSMLHEYGDQEVISIASKYGFRMDRCYFEKAKFRANGKWVNVDEDLAAEISRKGKLNHQLCPECYSQTVSMTPHYVDDFC